MAPVPKGIVLWNLLDFAHVNWMHRRNYAFCRVLGESPSETILEYGVRYLFFLGLPFHRTHTMSHFYLPPGVVVHSSTAGKTRTFVTMHLVEIEGQTTVRHEYTVFLPRLAGPLKPLLRIYFKLWSAQLWKEDLAMLERRHKVLRAGFKDHPVDVTPRKGNYNDS